MKPMIVALCGAPTSGKSTIQDILHRHFGLVPFDDGHVLRKHCMELFDLSEDDVSTQEGKKRFTHIQGFDWENRKIIGEYGNLLEQCFGEFTVPNWSIRTALRDWELRQKMNRRDSTTHLTAGMWRPTNRAQKVNGYSFGSVRRNQGKAYLDAGGIVVEITRRGVEQTGNIWDEYDRKNVTHTFSNDGSLGELEQKFCTFFDALLEQQTIGRAA